MNGKSTRRNIRIESIKNLDWNRENVVNSLCIAADYACSYADQSAEWYLRFKKWKRIGARWLRIGAIVLLALAGTMPMIQQLGIRAENGSSISPVWASILMAAAVFLIALDKYLGLSTGWIRYVQAESQIRRIRQEFELDWQALLASYAGTIPTAEQIQHALAIVKSFLTQVNGIISDETQKWVAEFQAALKQVDEQIQAGQSAVRSGSISVTVTNGDAVEPPGWSISVDSGPGKTYTGKTAAIVGLLPGDHTISIIGNVNGRPLRAEAVGSVQPGTSTALQVTLA
jgi:hypothetical protein